MFNLLDTINLISVTQLSFFIILLAFRRRDIVSWEILILFLITQLLSYGNYFLFRFGTEKTLPGYLITVPAGFIVTPLYYWYIRSRLFKKTLKFKAVALHLLPALISVFLVILDNLALKINFKPLSWLSEFNVFNTSLHMQILCYNISAWFLINKFKSCVNDYYSTRNFKNTDWIEFLIYSYIITSTVIGTLEIIFPLNEIMIVSYILFWLFLNVIYFKALILPVNIVEVEEDKQVRSRINEETVQTLFPIIEKVIREEKLYLKPELTLKELSQGLKISDRTVSQIIKQQTGRNFCDFVNFYRIEYAKEKMTAPENKGLTILEVLYDSGFNSKSVFNFQFRKLTGKSPTQFKENYFFCEVNEKMRPES